MSNEDRREVVGGIIKQGVNEGIFYGLDTEPWGGTPTSVDFFVYDEDDLTTDLKSTLAVGTPSVASDVITLPKFSGGTLGKVYRIEIQFTNAGSQELEAYCRVKIE